MIKKITSLIITLVMLVSAIPTFAAKEDTANATQAAYGTPTIDGQIESLWDSTNYNIISRTLSTGKYFYKGWFKVLWDEHNMYVLAKIYTSQMDNSNQSPWNNDSFEVFVDEDGKRTTKYENDDYQLRSDFDGNVSGQNHNLDNVKTATQKSDEYFIVEMAYPFKTISPTAGQKIGFDVQVNASATVAAKRGVYVWSKSSVVGGQSNNTSVFGTLTFEDKVSVTKFNEPEWVKPQITPYAKKDKSVTYTSLTDVTTYFDDVPFNYTIIHANDYPCMAVDDLAKVIGGESDGSTITKDGYSIKYTNRNRLAEDKNGHIMLERTPFINDGRLFVPMSSLEVTLGYKIEYPRFDKALYISTGTNYPEREVIVNVADYGAVGDGAADDKDAILRAFNAAVMSGKPSKLVFEANKTYRVSEKMDNMAFFQINGVNNFTLEGNGSKILFDTPTNTFMYIVGSADIHINNIEAEWKEHTSTQGRIIAVDNENCVLTMEIDEDFVLPPDDEWVAEFQGSSAAWNFSQIMDPIENRLKFMPTDAIFASSVKHVKGRIYNVQLESRHKSTMPYIEVGDRMALKSKYFAYDMPTSCKGSFDATNAIVFFGSKDVTLDGVYVYGGHMFMLGAGFCEGRLNIKNSGMKLKDGALEVTNADGLHFWRNRAAVTVEGCTLLNNLDDHMNTTSVDAVILSKKDDRTFLVDYDLRFQSGDEIVFFNSTNHTVLGTGYLEYCEEGGGYLLHVDRDIKDVITQADRNGAPTYVYNASASSKGTIVRNNKFIHSRRHAYIVRSANTIFENNEIINCGGSSVAAMNELVDQGQGRYEGPFPSSFTIRNNYTKNDGIDGNYFPLEIKSYNALLGEDAPIEGMLIENNVFDSAVDTRVMSINSVDGLYMLNNTIRCDKATSEKLQPIVISNSKIEMIDGITFDYPQNVNAVISIAGCKVNEENIKNIKIKDGNTAKPYTIE